MVTPVPSTSSFLSAEVDRLARSYLRREPSSQKFQTTSSSTKPTFGSSVNAE